MAGKILYKYRILLSSVLVIVIVFEALSAKWRLLRRYTFTKSSFRVCSDQECKGGKVFATECAEEQTYCPENPPFLLGTKTATSANIHEETVPDFAEIAEANPNISEGGRFSPRNCKPRAKIAIIIPYRQRELQLRGLLAHMHPVWQRQQLEYTVYVITQAGNGLFNRAKLLNAGFIEASTDSSYDCFVFHDVDILLENDECSYRCPTDPTQVKHLSAYLDKFEYKLRKYVAKCPPPEYDTSEIVNFGGITAMSSSQFREVNGYSNMYWGWGGEDDEMALRVWKKGFNITRDERCRHRMYKHDRVDQNFLRKRILNSCFKRFDSDGLSSTTYKLLSKDKNALYTNITVDVGFPSEAMLALIEDKHERRICDGDIFLDREKFW